MSPSKGALSLTCLRLEYSGRDGWCSEVEKCGRKMLAGSMTHHDIGIDRRREEEEIDHEYPWKCVLV